MPATSVTSMSEDGAAMEMSKDSEAEKRMRTETGGSHSNPQERQGGVDLNFPLSGEKGPACLVKVHVNAGVFFCLFLFLFCFLGGLKGPSNLAKIPTPSLLTLVLFYWTRARPLSTEIYPSKFEKETTILHQF